MSDQYVTDKFPTEQACESQVYFVRIGKHIKIGVTTNLKNRLHAFRSCSAEEITVLLTISGDREVERRLHDLFREERIRLEFFRECWLISEFVHFVRERGVAFAFEYIETWKQQRQREWDKTPQQRKQERLAEEERRTGWDGRLETYKGIFDRKRWKLSSQQQDDEPEFMPIKKPGAAECLKHKALR